MNRFRKHLKDTGETLVQFASRIGVSQSYLSEIAAFRKNPSLKVAVDIEDATDGKIPSRYWLADEEER